MNSHVMYQLSLARTSELHGEAAERRRANELARGRTTVRSLRMPRLWTTERWFDRHRPRPA